MHDLRTETEAKKCWCPFSRVIPGRLDVNGGMRMDGAVPPHNRVQERDEPAATWHAAMDCLASKCMAWRWARVDVSTPIAHMRGWCGLAGKPQLALPDLQQ